MQAVANVQAGDKIGVTISWDNVLEKTPNDQTPEFGRFGHGQNFEPYPDHYGRSGWTARNLDDAKHMARELLCWFQIGTSSHWPGACIFWYIDEHDRIRGGQINLLGSDWHTVKYVDREGVKRSKMN